MAWNGSEVATSAATNKKTVKTKNATLANSAPVSGAFMGIVALIIIVILGGLAYVCFTNDEVKSKINEKLPKKQIAEVEADVVSVDSNNEASFAKNKTDFNSIDAKATEPIKLTISERYGTGKPYTNQTEIARSKYDCFEHQSETQLAFLINQPIGNLVIGDWDYDSEEFRQDLQDALLSEIRINKEDSDEVVTIKESVIALKKELKQMLRDGEDIIEIIKNTRSELKQLGIYKEELVNEVEGYQLDGDLSEEEVEDFVKAANIMLESKGIEPMHFSKTTKMILRSKPLEGYEEEQDEEE